MSAAELGRLDITAPGAMISVCGGIGEDAAADDKRLWQPCRSSCNSQQTALPNAVVAQTASFSFVIDVGGTMAGQGVTDSFSSLVRFGVKPYNDDAPFAPGPASAR